LDMVECALECGHDDIATCPHFQAVIDGLPGTAGGSSAVSVDGSVE
jgi:hypothetical protein